MDFNELRDLQARLGVSGVELARYAGVSERAVRYWRTGEDRIPPALATLLRLLAEHPAALPVLRTRVVFPARVGATSRALHASEPV